MLPLTRTKQILGVLGLLVFILLSGVVFIYSQIQNKAETIAALEQELDADFQKESQKANLQRLVSETAEQRAELSSLFVDPQGTAAFIERVENLANTAQVVLEINNVALSPAQSPVLEILELDLRVRGQWQEVIHFARLLEALPLHINLEELSLTHVTGPTDSSSPVWEADIFMRTHKISEDSPEEFSSEPTTNDSNEDIGTEEDDSATNQQATTTENPSSLTDEPTLAN